MTAKSQSKPDKTVPQGRFSRTPQIVQSAFFGIMFSAALTLTALGTLYSLSDNPVRNDQAYPILMSNLALVILLGIYLGYRVWRILFAKKIRRSAPLLHRRFVVIFSLAALIPAILVAAFSTSLISRNMTDVFDEDVRAVLESSSNFLDEYVTEELRYLGLRVLETERFLEANKSFFDDRISFTYYMQRLALNIDVDAIYVINREGAIYSQFISPNSPDYAIPMPDLFDHIETTKGMGVQKQDEIDYLIGLKQLSGYDDLYVMVGQYLKSNVGVLSSLSGIEDTKVALLRQKNAQDSIRKAFFLTFVESALLIMFAAIWLGVVLANTIIEPLGRIIQAAEQVRSGDLTARVSVKRDWGEMSDLGSAFNRMTRQLSSQREDIIQERDVSEQRRQFSEAVLSGVTAGVIGLTQDGRITLMNASAERLTGHRAAHILGHPLDIVFPEFSEAFNKAREHVGGNSEHQVNLDTVQGIRNFDLRVSGYEGARHDIGWVITFDDMTRLVTAQRHSAWREVARRIAHEIKNPLTPIQLSTERLKRKYRGKISHDPDIFENCTDTILRQVGSLEQMVDEFSSFARMPAPEFTETDIKTLLETVLFAQGVAFPDVRFDLKARYKKQVTISLDERLMSQALTNIYKNAAESIAARVDEAGLDEPDGSVSTHMSHDGDNLLIEITDNGRGWPFPDTERLLEPYVTTRNEGTGLGLAIVRRTIEDHAGRLTLANRTDNKTGAVVKITLPIVKTSHAKLQNKSSKRKAKTL